MLPKTLRLDLVNEYKNLRANGRWWRGLLFDLLYLIVPQNEDTKIAVVVGKKISLLSVGRHLLKRQLSEALLINKTKILPGTKLIIFAKKEISGKKFSEIEREISTAIGQINK